MPPSTQTETFPPTTRLAPSPTGALHLGNARTFLVNWALARQQGWHILLRIEDLDTPRVKPTAIADTIDILSWLGIDWDSGPIIQSDDLTPYRSAMQTLASKRLAYSCELTRSEIEAAASAPQEGAHDTRFPPELRPPVHPTQFGREDTNWRFACPKQVVNFTDTFTGPVAVDPHAEVGDFVVWTRRGQPSYQLAVVVDDHRQGVTHIVRGNDLLSSAGRQILLSEALGLGPLPQYLHLPLVRGQDGRRLAKRHGDTRLSTYREQGVDRDRVIGLMAFWCGISPIRKPLSPDAFRELLRVDTISRDDIVFTQEDERWLQARS